MNFPLEIVFFYFYFFCGRLTRSTYLVHNILELSCSQCEVRRVLGPGRSSLGIGFGAWFRGICDVWHFTCLLLYLILFPDLLQPSVPLWALSPHHAWSCLDHGKKTFHLSGRFQLVCSKWRWTDVLEGCDSPVRHIPIKLYLHFQKRILLTQVNRSLIKFQAV